ncbi:MAG: metal-dependent transcriptional regulator [Deltaproteobacteria bacterium]|nr:metal-dependent transcriptional regulator [Deltaproteobacteria bacterium]
MKTSPDLSESLEDYLEAILDLERTSKVARTKDIAEKLAIKPGSVTGALKALGEKGLINYSPYNFITLTPQGKKIAQEIRNRHKTLKHFLHKILQVDDATADATACRMEHAIDPESLEKLVCFVDFIQTCPRTGEDWLAHFTEHCRSKGPDAEQCRACLEELRSKPLPEK